MDELAMRAYEHRLQADVESGALMTWLNMSHIDAVLLDGPDGWQARVLFTFEGAVLFEHRCDRTAQGRGVIVCAPALQIGNGHTIVQRDPLTIVASVLCPDCQTHGFVTDGRWVPA